MSSLTASLIQSPSSPSSGSSVPQVTFHDIYDIDDPLFLVTIPRPVSALIFLCPGSVYNRARHAEEASMPLYKGCGENEPVTWFKQTIRHSCGLMALVHALSNSRGRREYIQPGSLLDSLLAESIPLEPEARAKVLYNSIPLEHAHAAATVQGDTASPEDLNSEFHHFITFVKAEDGTLWELNGGMNGPIARGHLGDDEDALHEKALDLGVRTILQHVQEEPGFSIVAMSVGDL